MKKFTKLKQTQLTLALAGLMGLGISSAQASPINNLILDETNELGFTVLFDESAESVFVINDDNERVLKEPTVGGTLILEEGDLLRGIARISDIGNESVQAQTGHELTAIFELVVTRKFDSAAGCPQAFCFEFGASSLFASEMTALGFSNTSGSVIGWFDDDSPDFNRTTDTGAGNEATDIANMEATATDGDLFWLFGLDGIDDFWYAEATNDDILDVTANTRFVNFGIGLSLLDNPNGVGLNEFDCAAQGQNSESDFCATGNVSTKPTTVTSAYGVFNDFEITVSPIPEPASLALVGLGLLGMGAFTRRRKV